VSLCCVMLSAFMVSVIKLSAFMLIVVALLFATMSTVFVEAKQNSLRKNIFKNN
jgi:hypothetical protein